MTTTRSPDSRQPAPPTTTDHTSAASAHASHATVRPATPSAPPGRPSVRRRGVTWFLVLTFGWSWAALAVAWVLGVSLDNPVAQLLTVAMVPAFCAVIVRRWITREGFTDAGLRPRLREHWKHYAAALLIPGAALAVGLGLAAVTGMWSPDASFDPGALALTVATGPLVAVATAWLFWGEEFGWTAYLRDRLLPGRPVATTFLTGCIWGVWHFPLPWVGYFGGGVDVTDAFIAMLLWLPLSILLEFLIGWLWAETGSVWSGALLHAGSNLVAAAGLGAAFGGQISMSAQTALYCCALLPFVVAVLATGHVGRSQSPSPSLPARRSR